MGDEHFVHRIHIFEQKVDYQLRNGELWASDTFGEEEVDMRSTYHCDCGQSFLKEERVIEHWLDVGWIDSLDDEQQEDPTYSPLTTNTKLP